MEAVDPENFNRYQLEASRDADGQNSKCKLKHGQPTQHYLDNADLERDVSTPYDGDKDQHRISPLKVELHRLVPESLLNGTGDPIFDAPIRLNAEGTLIALQNINNSD